MADSADRRFERTRHALEAAFLDLLMTRGYEALTVGDIVAKANVGRSTFYDHYRGKDDMLRLSVAGPFATLAGLVGAAEPNPGLVPLIEHFWQSRKLGRVLFAGPARSLLAAALAGLIEPRLGPARPQSGPEPVLPLRLAALQLAEMQLALLDHWFAGRIACRPAAIAEALVLGTDALARVLLRL
jgi:AcrR family transcriptional regulator